MSAHSCNEYCRLDYRLHRIQKSNGFYSVDELVKYLESYVILYDKVVAERDARDRDRDAETEFWW